MAKATPEELAAHKALENSVDEVLEKQIDAPSPATGAVDNTPPGEAEAAAPKRGRGRPSNAEKALNEQLNKETPGDSTPGTTASKPSKKAQTKSAPTAEGLGKQLVGIHALAAMFLQIPQVQITEQEGAMLGSAIIAVCEQYNLAVSGKTGAAIQLFAAAAMIYGPRVLYVKGQIAANHAAKNQVPDNVHPFVGPTGN